MQFLTTILLALSATALVSDAVIDSAAKCDRCKTNGQTLCGHKGDRSIVGIVCVKNCWVVKQVLTLVLV